MKRRKLVAMLAIVATISTMFGCGATEEKPSEPAATESETVKTETAEPEAEKKEPVTIAYWYNNGVGEQEYTDEVEAKLNEMLAADPETSHITLDLKPQKDYKTNFALAQASGEQIDLVSTPSLDYVAEVANGSFIVLDDLLAKYPEASAELPAWLMEMGKVDGETYMVPNYQQGSNNAYLIIPTEYMEMAEITDEDVLAVLHAEEKSVDDLAALLEKLVLGVRKGTGLETKWLMPFADAYYYQHPSNHEVNLQWFSYYYWDGEKLVYSLTDPIVQEAIMKNAEFYEKGYLHPDIATLDWNTMARTEAMNEESYIVSFENGQYGDLDMASPIFSERYGYDCKAFPIYDYSYIQSSWAAGGLSISATCEHPEEAMKIISMLTNSKYADFYNLLVYGLEDVHYEKTGENTVHTTEFDGSQGGVETTYCYHKWRGGNTFNAWLNQSLTEEMESYILNEVNEGEKTVVSPFVGHMFDTSDYETEIAQIKATQTEFYDNTGRVGAMLLGGSLGVEGTEKALKEFNQKLEAADLNILTEALNQQAQEFINQ